QERLRIGYLSGVFFSHPVMHLMVGVIEQHDRARYEVIGYDFAPPANDAYRGRLEAAFDRMTPIMDMPDHEAAALIARDGIDIVIDLAGWTKRTRTAVLPIRPPPVQLQWLGYPGTLRAPRIDYIRADPVVIPAPDRHHLFQE